MKKIILFTFTVLMFYMPALADEEFSDYANVNYGYDERYDETEKAEDITSSASDDIKKSYNEDYDENYESDITSNKYDDKVQEYNENFDERQNEQQYTGNTNNGISVVYNGEKLKFDVEPMLINDRTMVPMRVIFELLGAKVNWDEATQTAIGKTNKLTVKITVGQDFLIKNDNIVVLDTPAVVVSDRTLVPVRAIAESLDCRVNWYEQTQVVEITKR